MEKNINTFIFALSIIGIILSIYLWWIQASDRIIPCTLDGCDNVLKSEYSKIFGAPMSAYGVFYFLAIAFVSFEKFFLKHKILNITSNILIFWGVIFIIYLRYLEFYKIGSICEWCWAVAFVVILMMFATITQIVKKTK